MLWDPDAFLAVFGREISTTPKPRNVPTMHSKYPQIVLRHFIVAARYQVDDRRTMHVRMKIRPGPWV